MTKQPQSIDTIAAQAGSHEDRGGAVSFPSTFRLITATKA